MATIDDFRETVPTREITTETEKTFSRPWPCGACFLTGRNAAASIAPTLIRHRLHEPW